MTEMSLPPKSTAALMARLRAWSESRTAWIEEIRRRHIARDEDCDFMGDLQAAVSLAPRASASILMLSILFSFLAVLLWATFAEVEQVASGKGRIIPSSQVQLIQSLEGGIVAGILVHEGQMVRKREPLLLIDDTQAMSKYKEDRTKYLGFRAAIARLEAEADGRSDPQFPDEVITEAPNLVASERELARTRAESLHSAVAIFLSQIEQKQREVQELEARVHQLEQSRQLAVEEANILSPLVEKGVAAKLELLQLRRQINDIEGTLAGTRQGLLRARSAVEEARQRLDERRNALRSEAQQQLNEMRLSLSGLSENLKSTHDRLQRTELKSPVDGTIKQLYVNTVGGVIKSGQDIIAIVPREDSLLVEARIRPSDIAFLYPGQNARVRITAYDYAVYGALDARLVNISADSIIDEKGESYFKVTLRTGGSLTRAGEPLPIIPGMTADVDIVTGSRTVLEYLLQPIFRAQQKAMRER